MDDFWRDLLKAAIIGAGTYFWLEYMVWEYHHTYKHRNQFRKEDADD